MLTKNDLNNSLSEKKTPDYKRKIVASIEINVDKQYNIRLPIPNRSVSIFMYCCLLFFPSLSAAFECAIQSKQCTLVESAQCLKQTCYLLLNSLSKLDCCCLNAICWISCDFILLSIPPRERDREYYVIVRIHEVVLFVSDRSNDNRFGLWCTDENMSCWKCDRIGIFVYFCIKLKKTEFVWNQNKTNAFQVFCLSQGIAASMDSKSIQ